jgi:CheY-like chemotaxis protein
LAQWRECDKIWARRQSVDYGARPSVHIARLGYSATARELGCFPRTARLRGDSDRVSRILITDDDPGIRRFLQRALSHQGYTATTAANGKEGLIAIEQEPPDLLVLDLMMPIMDGWELYSTLETPNYPQFPIIVITAGERLSQAQQDLPKAHVLAKPFDLDEFLELVHELLNHHASVQA